MIKYSQDVKVNSNSFISISQYFNVVKSKRVKLIYYFMAFSTTGMVFFFKTGSFKKPLTMLLYIEALKYHDTKAIYFNLYRK